MMRDKIRQVELLAPAGNFEKGKIALLYGADAVYLGGKQFGLRAFADNFSFSQMADLCEYAHAIGKKVYLTVNVIAHNDDIVQLPHYLADAEKCGIDALLISDLGVWKVAKDTVPNLALHVSTQANTTNYASVLVWQEFGAQRVVLARELSLAEIGEIGRRTDVELECFVHGAMCISYSGRCFLSAYLTGRDGNRGACTQACRWKYNLVEEKRPGQYFQMQENDRGTFIMNSKDLCLLKYLPDLIRAGVSSLKIEGRMRSVHYVATVVSVYRKAIDACLRDGEHYIVSGDWLTELEKVSHRPYTTGFALHKPDSTSQVYASSSYIQTYEFVALVLSYDIGTKRLYLEQRNYLQAGEEVEILMPDGNMFDLTLENMLDDQGEIILAAPHAQQHFSVDCDRDVPAASVVRRRILQT